MRICAIADCGKKHYGRGLCKLHYQQDRRGADLSGRMVDNPVHKCVHKWVDRPVGHGGAHSRVRRVWGSASQYPCIECGNTAKDWAYDGTDPTQLYEARGGRAAKSFYSLYPEFYMPMCAKCHALRDKGAAAIELQMYRTIAHKSGLSGMEIIESITDITSHRASRVGRKLSDALERWAIHGSLVRLIDDLEILSGELNDILPARLREST